MRSERGGKRGEVEWRRVRERERRERGRGGGGREDRGLRGEKKRERENILHFKNLLILTYA